MKTVKIFFAIGEEKDVRSKEYKKKLKRLGIDPNKEFNVHFNALRLNTVVIITQDY